MEILGTEMSQYCGNIDEARLMPATNCQGGRLGPARADGLDVSEAFVCFQGALPEGAGVVASGGRLAGAMPGQPDQDGGQDDLRRQQRIREDLEGRASVPEGP